MVQDSLGQSPCNVVKDRIKWTLLGRDSSFLWGVLAWDEKETSPRVVCHACLSFPPLFPFHPRRKAVCRWNNKSYSLIPRYCSCSCMYSGEFHGTWLPLVLGTNVESNQSDGREILIQAV